MNCSGRHSARGGGELRPPEPQRDPLEFLSRSWSASAADVSRALAASAPAAIAEDVAGELDDCSSGAGTASGSSFSFASAATSQLILDRIMSQSQEVSPLTSGRLSHSSGPLNGGGSLSDSPPVSPDVDDGRNSEHAEAAAAAAARREQDGGAVVQGPEGEAEGGSKGAQRAGARRRLGGGRGRGGRRCCRRHRGVRQGRPRRAHRHGGGLCCDAGGRSVRGGRGIPGRRARAPRRRRRLRRQRQDPRRHRHHHGRRRHRVARRGDAEGEGAEGSAERGGGDPRGQGLHGNGRPQQARRSEAAAATSQGGAGSGQQQQQQLQRRPAGAGPGREQQLPRHLLPRAARPRHRAPQAHPQRIVALEGCLSVHQPDRRGDAEDEKPACRRDHNQEEEERGGGRVQGRGGVARAAPAGRRRAPALLWPAHGGAPRDRVRVREPEGSRHVDQGSGTPPRHRRWPQALRLRPAPSWTAAAAMQLVVSNGCVLVVLAIVFFVPDLL